MAAICRSTIIKESTPLKSEWALRSLRNDHAVYVGMGTPLISEWLRRSVGICIFDRLSTEDVKAYICKEYARGVLRLCSEICADGSIEAFEFGYFGQAVYLIDMLLRSGKVIEIKDEERNYIFPDFEVDDHTKINIYFDCSELSEVNVRCEVVKAD